MEDKAVIGIVWNPERTKILMIKRRDVPIWVFPGGGVEPEEEAEAAIIREVHEETGLKVKIIRKVGEYTPLNRLARFTQLYECESIEGTPKIGAETRDINFYKFNELPNDAFFLHKDWLQDALKKQPYVIKKLIHQITYKKLLTYFIKHPFQVLRITLSRFGFPINSRS